MNTLTWENGRCNNSPLVRLDAYIDRDPDGNWQWRASWARGFADMDGYPTERQAQLACEAFLWRNGILPLPGWNAYEMAVWDWWARIEHRYQGPDSAESEYWFCVGIAGVPWVGANGERRTAAAAKAAAELHLRAEIAAYLDGLAAKETP